MKFAKGQSGNPGGRPAAYGEVRMYARSYTNEAVETLVMIMRSSKAPAASRVSAANAILDRGWGKPANTFNVKRDSAEDDPEPEVYYEEIEHNKHTVTD